MRFLDVACHDLSCHIRAFPRMGCIPLRIRYSQRCVHRFDHSIRRASGGRRSGTELQQRQDRGTCRCVRRSWSRRRWSRCLLSTLTCCGRPLGVAQDAAVNAVVTSRVASVLKLCGSSIRLRIPHCAGKPALYSYFRLMSFVISGNVVPQSVL